MGGMRKALLILLLAGPAVLAAGDESGEARSNLEYWLDRAEDAGEAGATRPAIRSPEAPADTFTRPDALPGVLKLSDGTLLPGGLYTTTRKNLELYVASEKRWRRVPLAAVLSIEAIVREQRMELRWRWKAMGVPEKVYTGEKYPLRKTDWKLLLIDGTDLTGSIKGQPLWVERRGKRHGPFVLHERHKGKDGQTFEELVYVEKVVISRREMKRIRARLVAQKKKPAGDPQKRTAPRKTTTRRGG